MQLFDKVLDIDTKFNSLFKINVILVTVIISSIDHLLPRKPYHFE